MGMTRSEIAAKIAALKATLGEPEESPEPAEPTVLTKSQIAQKIATLKQSLIEEPIEPEEAEEGLSRRVGQFGRGFLSEIGTASDVPLYSNNIMAPYDENLDQQAAWLGRKPENPIVQMAEQLPESAGLGREYEPSPDDTLGKVSSFAGRMLAPTPMLPLAGYGNVIAGASKGLKPAAKALAKDIGMVGAQAAAIKGTPRLTDEGGISGALEDITKGIGTGYGLSKTGKGLRRITSPESDIKLTDRNERKVGNYLSKTIGEDNLEDVSQNLKNYKSDIGYEPLTGEIAGDPTFAQLQRAREGVVGTGIAQKQGAGASTIVKALEGAETTKEDLLSVQNYIRDRLRSLEGNVEKGIGTLSPRLDADEAAREIQEGFYSNKSRANLEDRVRGSISQLSPRLEAEEALREIKDAAYSSRGLSNLERNVENSLSQLSPRLNASEAGKSLQEGVYDVLNERKAARRSATKPLYEEVKKNLNPLKPSNALNYLKNEIVSGDVEKDFEYFKKQLLPKNVTKKDLSYKKSYDSALREASKYSEDSVNKFIKSSPAPKEASVAQLAAVRKAIVSRMQRYKSRGENERVLMLKELKNNLDLDMSEIKAHQEAKKIYRELSPPVSEITKQKALNSISRNIDDQFLMTESRVPEVFINSTAGSIDDSKALLNVLKNKPKEIEVMKSYLNDKAVNEISDPYTGKVDSKRIANFKNKYPGAKILYPELYNTKLNNICNAQAMVNNFMKSSDNISSIFKTDSLGKSVEGSKELLNQLKDNPKAMGSIRANLNEKAAASIIDNTGTVNLKKLEAFKEKYPGAKVLYPELYNVKLKELGSAQTMVNEFIKNSEDVLSIFKKDSLGKSLEDSRALLKNLQGKQKAMESVRNHLHEKAFASIIEPETGTVNLKKLEAFKEKYPGAKVLYPELYNVKLKDIGHAQVMVNRFLKNTEAVSDTLYKDVLGETVGKDTKNIMKNLFNEHSTENVGNLVEELSKDASGEKMAALRKETLKYFKKKITNAGAEGEHNVLSYPKMKSFMDSHENALKKVLTPEQIKVVKGVEKIVEGKNKAATQGMAKGSPTNANIVNALDLYQSGSSATGFIRKKLLTLGLGTPWVGEFLREWKTVQLRKNLEILDKAIIDHNYADFLLSTPLKSKQDALDFSSQMKKFSNKRYLSPELTALARKEQSNEKE